MRWAVISRPKDSSKHKTRMKPPYSWSTPVPYGNTPKIAPFSEIGRLRRWKARRPGRKIVVTGCAAERTKEYLEDRFPFVDLVVGAKSIEDFGGSRNAFWTGE